MTTNSSTLNVAGSEESLATGEPTLGASQEPLLADALNDKTLVAAPLDSAKMSAPEVVVPSVLSSPPAAALSASTWSYSQDLLSLIARPTWWLFFLILFLSAANEVIVYLTGHIPSQFYEKLLNRDKGTPLGMLIFTSTLYISLNALGLASKHFVGNLLTVKIRKDVTYHFHKKYLHNTAYYDLQLTCTKIDNPDQRIAQDIDKFSDSLSKLGDELIMKPFLVLFYTYKCWKGFGWVGPAVVIVYFLVGSGLIKLTMKPFVQAVMKREKCEGDFRYFHVQIRDFAESIGLLKGVSFEQTRGQEKLEELLKKQKVLALKDYYMQIVHQFFAYQGSILSYLILAIPIYSGNYDSMDSAALAGFISASSFLCMYLIFQFTGILQLSNRFTETVGYTRRLGELWTTLQGLEKQSRLSKRKDVFSDAPKIVLDRLSLQTPTGKQIISGLSLTMEQGNHLLIRGPNGCGKTSLIRAMGGLWNAVSGYIEMHKQKETTDSRPYIFFIPSTPYLPSDASILDLITYPSRINTLPVDVQEKVEKILEVTELKGIATRMGLQTQHNVQWGQILSLGEQQKLNFARVMFKNPTFAIMDEPFSNLMGDLQRKLFQYCQDMGMTCVIVTHDEDFMSSFKGTVLEFVKNGEFFVSRKM